MTSTGTTIDRVLGVAVGAIITATVGFEAVKYMVNATFGNTTTSPTAALAATLVNTVLTVVIIVAMFLILVRRGKG